MHIIRELKQPAAEAAVFGAALLLALAVVAGALRLSMTPTYLQAAYRSLPPDAHGFSAAERLDLALLTLAFLHHPAEPQAAAALLARQTLPDGETPLYGARELAHLVDVKRLTDAAGAALPWLLLPAALLLLRRRRRGREALALAVKMVQALLLPGLPLLLLFWRPAFTAFHVLLFAPGTWTFAGDSTLIRLFPEAFWLGYALYTLGLVLLLNGGLRLAVRLSGRPVAPQTFAAPGSMPGADLSDPDPAPLPDSLREPQLYLIQTTDSMEERGSC